MTLPPITFIVTGYNQEMLIQDAIEGALSQDYPDLQIILTDDCSSDGTFARMQAAAASDRRPHEIIASQPARNVGTFGNIQDAFQYARGEIIIFAGGDDISKPQRSRVIAEAWLHSKADAYYSRYDVIGEDGALLARDWKPESDGLWLLDYFPGERIMPLHGASMACHRSVLERFHVRDVRIRSEDAYLTLMLAITKGRIEYIDQSLVQYRKHPGAITNEVPPAPNRESVAARERTQMTFADSQAQLLNLVGARMRERGLPPAVQAILADDKFLFELRARWADSRLLDRLLAIPAARRRRQLTWLLPRLAGFSPFVRAKAAALHLGARAARSHHRPEGQDGSGHHE